MYVGCTHHDVKLNVFTNVLQISLTVKTSDEILSSIHCARLNISLPLPFSRSGWVCGIDAVQKRHREIFHYYRDLVRKESVVPKKKSSSCYVTREVNLFIVSRLTPSSACCHNCSIVPSRSSSEIVSVDTRPGNDSSSMSVSSNLNR